MTLLPSTYRNNLSLQGRPDSLEAPMRDSDAAKGGSSVQKTGRPKGSLTTAWSAPGSPDKVPKMQAGRLQLPRRRKREKNYRDPAGVKVFGNHRTRRPNPACFRPYCSGTVTPFHHMSCMLPSYYTAELASEATATYSLTLHRKGLQTSGQEGPIAK